MGDTTTNLGLYKPDEGEDGWADLVNANWDVLDSSGGGGGVGFNVKDYGAVGDNVTDDTAAIQAAIDAAGATVNGGLGGMVWFPKGNYVVTDTVEVANYTILTGENDNAVRIKADSSFPTGTAVVNIGPNPSGNGDMNGCGLRNIRVDCNQVADSTGIKMTKCNEHCMLDNVEVRNFDQYAVDCTTSGNFKISRFAASGFATSGCLYVMYLHGNVGQILLETIGNLSTGVTSGDPAAGSCGIYTDSGGIHVWGLHVEHVETGILFADGYGGTVIGARGHSSVANVVSINNGHAGTVACMDIDDAGGDFAVVDIPRGRKYGGQLAWLPNEDNEQAVITELPKSIGSANSGVSSTTVAMTVTRAVAVGSFVVVGANYGGTSNTPVSVTDSKGNTYQLDASIVPSGAPGTTPGNCVLATSKIGTALAIGDTITFTATNATVSKVIGALDCAGLTTSSWFDKTASINTNSTSPWSSGATATTAQASELLIGLVTLGSSAGTQLDAPWAQGLQQQHSSRTMTLGWRQVTSTGTYAYTGTFTTPAAYAAMIGTYKYA